MQAGDFACVLFGADVPFILQKCSGDFVIVGEAYKARLVFDLHAQQPPTLSYTCTALWMVKLQRNSILTRSKLNSYDYAEHVDVYRRIECMSVFIRWATRLDVDSSDYSNCGFLVLTRQFHCREVKGGGGTDSKVVEPPASVSGSPNRAWIAICRGVTSEA